MSNIANVSDLTPQQLRQIKEAGKRGQILEARYPFTTGLLLHKIHDRLILEIVKAGFEVTQDAHDGGLITRSHIICFRGNAWDVVIMGRALDNYLKQWSAD